MKYYQNVGIGGVEYEDPKRINSKYWNEGKWDNYIKPLLPEHKNTFIEVGCNAGLFLKLAKETGFKNVIGIEGGKKRFKQAEKYREVNGLDYKLINKPIQDVNLDDLPLADVVLFSNTHYYIPIAEFMNVVNKLKGRCAYCIIVSAQARRLGNMAAHYLESPGIRGYFKYWREIKFVGDPLGLEKLTDSTARKQMYGILFKGDLDSVNTDELYDVSEKWENKYKNDLILPCLEKFFKDPLNESSLFEYWKNQGYSEKEIRHKLNHNLSLFKDIKENGMKEPVFLNINNKVLDGVHRMTILKELNYSEVLVRRL